MDTSEATGNLATNQDDGVGKESLVHDQSSTLPDGSVSHSAKDIDKDRREIGSTGSHKIRSHSAPGGVSYTRVYTQESNPES